MKSTRHRRRLSRRFRSSQVPAGLLNLTSMIDIFTVLLFFLLVYSADLAIFTPLAVLDLNLPSANAPAPPPGAPFRLEVVVRQADLEVLRNGSTVSRIPHDANGAEFQSLAKTLVKLKAQSPTTSEITIRPQPDVSYDLIVQVMDAARAELQMSGGGPVVTRELFPEVLIGDAP
jgi:biopolymer transport protein ExbD